jgi:hypothetical protein
VYGSPCDVKYNPAIAVRSEEALSPQCAHFQRINRFYRFCGFLESTSCVLSTRVPVSNSSQHAASSAHVKSAHTKALIRLEDFDQHTKPGASWAKIGSEWS